MTNRTYTFNPHVIAEACHEANRVITRHIDDVPVQPAWVDAPDEMRLSSIAGVVWRLQNLDAPASAQHEAWMRGKLADGWTFGPHKDVERKTHPALIPYDDLPSAVQAKDHLFTAIVRTLGGPPKSYPIVAVEPGDVKWERVTREVIGRQQRVEAITDRLAVAGGWIYRITNHEGTQEVAIAMVFVPTPPLPSPYGDAGPR